jgi:hypothetical protein
MKGETPLPFYSPLHLEGGEGDELSTRINPANHLSAKVAMLSCFGREALGLNFRSVM